MVKPLKYTIEQAIEAIKTSKTLSEAIKKCGQQRNYITFKKIIKDYNVDTSHFDPTANRFKVDAVKRSLKEVMVENSNYKTHNLKVRLFREKIFEKKCYECGRTEWMGKPIPLELEHKNAQNNDHRLENLTILCSNCHSQNSSYCKGKRGLK